MVWKCMASFSPILTTRLTVPVVMQKERFLEVHMHFRIFGLFQLMPLVHRFEIAFHLIFVQQL